MTHRVLVVDDSPTIQKVVKLSLAGGEYSVDECLSEEDLFPKLHSEEGYSLILLDFNFSSSQSGSEIIQEVRKVAPDTPIMAMLGVFDSIADAESIGVQDTVVKPFDSTTFIDKCRVLVGLSGLAEAGADPVGDWELDAPNVQEIGRNTNEEQEESREEAGEVDVLSQEVEGWGMSVPSPIGRNHDDEVLFPPRFSGGGHGSDQDSAALNQISNLDTIDPDLKTDWYDDASGPEVELEAVPEPEQDMEIDPDTFWSVDSVDDGAEAVTVTEEPLVSDNSNEDDEIVKKVRAELEPVVEELVRKFCQQKVEQVAWEVIPDLAENLIRNEIKEISMRYSGQNIDQSRNQSGS